MNTFRKFDKIHRLGKDETLGILEGTCYVQEKVDGANTSAWLDESGFMRLGSRGRQLGDEEFNGFVKYMYNYEPIKGYFADHPTHTLYGEWLVRHTIAYNETTYQKWYLFDIWDGEKYLTTPEVHDIAKAYGILSVPFLGEYENPTHEQLMVHVGKTEFGDRGEGIVIKNPGFTNQFGDKNYAKIVTESFKEDNATVFGGNNKFSDTYQEVYWMNKFMTLPRVKKIMDKLQPTINEKLDMKHIPQVMGMCYHDMITEEGWEIAKDGKKIDFKALERVCNKKSKQIFIDIITDSVSVADRVN